MSKVAEQSPKNRTQGSSEENEPQGKANYGFVCDVLHDVTVIKTVRTVKYQMHRRYAVAIKSVYETCAIKLLSHLKKK